MANVPSIRAGGGISKPFITSQSYQKQTLLQSLAKTLRSWTAVDIPTGVPQPSNLDGKVSVVCISDTHNTKPSIPDGDILLHAGDLSQYGLFDEVQSQLDWLNEQPHSQKFAIAGNHDLILDASFVKLHPDRELDKPGKSRGDLDWGNVTYLHNSSVDIQCNDRTLRIYGSPLTPKCGNFGFQHDPDDDVWANSVPEGTDIFLAHGPPAVYLDEGKGCKYLLKELWRAKPKLVVFGHIHGARGEGVITFERAQAYYENSLLGMRPWINVFKLLIYSLLRILGGNA